MTKLAPEWVRTSDPVIRSPLRYRWTTAPAMCGVWKGVCGWGLGVWKGGGCGGGCVEGGGGGGGGGVEGGEGGVWKGGC